LHHSIDIGFTTLPSYFTLLMVGITAGILLAHREGVRRNLDGNTILDLGLLMMAAGLIGARILHVLADGQFWDYVHLCTDPAQLPGLALDGGRPCVESQQCLSAGLGQLCDVGSGLCRQEQDCLRVFKIWYGGYVFYGGLLLAVPLGLAFLHRRKVAPWDVADLAAWAIPVGLVLGRLGCFLAGCCFGAVHDGPLGIAFPRYSPAWHQHLDAHLIDRTAQASLAVHPTQLYEAAAAAAIAGYCWWRYRKANHFRGELFFWFLLLYGIFRIGVEFLRADDRGDWIFGLFTTSQLVSVPLIVWSIWVLRRRRAWPFEPAAAVEQAAKPSEQAEVTRNEEG
jgi:phosphatidylglycerol:prolipoprotein diacylglycerol transferase